MVVIGEAMFGQWILQQLEQLLSQPLLMHGFAREKPIWFRSSKRSHHVAPTLKAESSNLSGL